MAFVRGLAIGALFGAAVAGSRIWRRGQVRGADEPRESQANGD
jgi:hypothetical protein